MVNLHKISGVVCPEIELLKIFEECADKGETTITGLKFEVVEEYLGISHNTLKKYLRQFRDSGVLKFTFNGDFVLNPEVFDLKKVLSDGEINARQVEFKVSPSN